MQQDQLDALKRKLAEQERFFKEYAAMLDAASEDDLASLCRQNSIPVRKRFTNRCALVLAKKNELRHFDLRREIEDLEAQAGREVYRSANQLNTALEMLELKRYHIFCQGMWHYSCLSAFSAMHHYRRLQKFGPVTMLRGQEIVFYGRMKPQE